MIFQFQGELSDTVVKCLFTVKYFWWPGVSLAQQKPTTHVNPAVGKSMIVTPGGVTVTRVPILPIIRVCIFLGRIKPRTPRVCISPTWLYGSWHVSELFLFNDLKGVFYFCVIISWKMSLLEYPLVQRRGSNKLMGLLNYDIMVIL